MTEIMGRPTKYDEEIVLKILELASEGKTRLQIAKTVGINYDTINAWEHKHPDFSDALKKAIEISDQHVEATLRMKAMGYKEKAVKFWYDSEAKEVITHEYEEIHAPDTTSIIFWLKNRQPKKWRDVQSRELTGKDGAPLTSQVILTMPDNGRDKIKPAEPLQIPNKNDSND